MSVLEELSTIVAGVAERVGPAVVTVGRDGRGAGVVVADGVVVTNAHNLRGAELTVTFAGGRRATGTVAGVDRDGDLAAVGVDTAGVQPVEWSSSESGPAPGAPVLAATRLPGGGTRVTVGFVSAVGVAFRGPNGHLVESAVEHTAALGRGSSGSPLIGLDGRLLGLNTHRLGEGFYLALPAGADLRRRVEALAEGRSPIRLRLGVVLAPAAVARRLRAAVGLEASDGLLVRAVEEGGPAAVAGVATGDLLVSAGGRDLLSADDLHAVLRDHDPGRPLALGLLRGADRRTVEVRFPG